MAVSVASLLTDALEKSKLFEKLVQTPTGKAALKMKEETQAKLNKIAMSPGGKATQIAAKVGMKAGGMAGGIGGAAIKAGMPMGGLAGKATMGMASKIGEYLPKLGKLAGPTQLLGLPKKLLSKGMGLMGINLSFSTLLRQSQLFTGILGALFQILGGFVDVILTPFMPFFIKIIRKLAEQIPKVREIAQKVFNWLNTHVFPVIKKGMDWIWDKIGIAVDWVSDNMPEIKEKIMGFFNNSMKALEPVLDTAKEIVGEVWGWGKTHLWPTLKEAFFTIIAMGKTLWEFIQTEVWPTLKSIFGNLKIIFEGLLLWLREDIYPLIKDAWDWLIKEIGGFILWLADNIVERLVTIIPMIQSIITQVVDILLHSILKPLWDALKPVLMWYANLVMDNWSHVIRILDTKILPFVKDIIDDLMPHIQDLSDFFMKHLAPKINEYFDAVWEFIDALLDVALPLIKWTLKYLIWPVAKFIIKVLALILGVVFKVMTWGLRVLTWLLKLPFTWRETLLNPILSALDLGLDWVKKIVWYVKNSRNMITAAMLGVLEKMLRRLSTQKIVGKGILPDISFDFLRGAADKLSQGLSKVEYQLMVNRRELYSGLSSSTGGMRAKYGTSVTEININNFSETKVLDDTRKLQLMAGEKRDIDNIQRREDTLGSYSEIPYGLRS